MAIARMIVRSDLSLAAAVRETSLWLTAHEDHKVGAFACLGAQCFV